RSFSNSSGLTQTVFPSRQMASGRPARRWTSRAARDDLFIAWSMRVPSWKILRTLRGSSAIGILSSDRLPKSGVENRLLGRCIAGRDQRRFSTRIIVHAPLGRKGPVETEEVPEPAVISSADDVLGHGMSFHQDTV